MAFASLGRTGMVDIWWNGVGVINSGENKIHPHIQSSSENNSLYWTTLKVWFAILKDLGRYFTIQIH